MNTALVMELSRDLFQTALLIALPALAAALIVGLVVSLLQAVTGIQDQTVGHVPRILVVGIVLVLTMGFTLTLAVAFAHRMFQHAARAGT
jgi:flagellar biosynthesis protein FliQ